MSEQTKIKVNCKNCGDGVQHLAFEDIEKGCHGLCPKCRTKLTRVVSS